MISVLVPAYDEESNIPLIGTELSKVMSTLREDYEIIVVDDGSTDGTAKAVAQLEMDNPAVRGVSHRRNMGLGAAIRTGIKEAKGEFLIPLDADFSFHPRQIPGLLELIRKEEADCVLVSPFLRPEDNLGIDFLRLLMSRSVNLLYRLLLGRRITEASGIFRVYRTDALRRIDLIATGFDINAEILFKLIKNKSKVVETYGPLTSRQSGESKMRVWKEGFNHLRLLLKILSWRLFG
jgi:dolichol-phosphate mannosyltransferase